MEERKSFGLPLFSSHGQLVSRYLLLSVYHCLYIYTHTHFYFCKYLFCEFQGHMMWLKRQDSFKEKFGNLDQTTDIEETS